VLEHGVLGLLDTPGRCSRNSPRPAHAERHSCQHTLTRNSHCGSRMQNGLDTLSSSAVALCYLLLLQELPCCADSAQLHGGTQRHSPPPHTAYRPSPLPAPARSHSPCLLWLAVCDTVLAAALRA
jgi:hypothetical protein